MRCSYAKKLSPRSYSRRCFHQLRPKNFAIRWLPQQYGVQGDEAPSNVCCGGNDQSLTHVGAKVLRGWDVGYTVIFIVSVQTFTHTYTRVHTKAANFNRTISDKTKNIARVRPTSHKSVPETEIPRTSQKTPAVSPSITASAISSFFVWAQK
jgi:hypothetical protein